MIIKVQAKTRARQNKIQQNQDGSFTIWTQAVAVDGKANLSISQIIAEYFDLPPSLVILQKGHRSDHKVFEIN